MKHAACGKGEVTATGQLTKFFPDNAPVQTKRGLAGKNSSATKIYCHGTVRQSQSEKEYRTVSKQLAKAASTRSALLIPFSFGAVRLFLSADQEIDLRFADGHIPNVPNSKC